MKNLNQVEGFAISTPGRFSEKQGIDCKLFEAYVDLLTDMKNG